MATLAIPVPLERARLIRFALIAVTVAILVLVVVELVYGLLGPPNWRAAVGWDLSVYANLSRKLFSGGGWFPPQELSGPFQLATIQEVLYPPVVAYVFAPFMFLPIGALWIMVAGTMAWLFREWRPALWTWPLMALCLLWPLTLLKGLSGTSTVLITMAVGLGLRYRWPFALILIKPSFLPLALIGIRSRGWWICVGVLVLLTLPYLTETLQYPTVLMNARGSHGGALYSLEDAPMIAIPVLAWLGRRAGP